MRISILILLFGFLSCSSLPSLNNFDSAVWKEDLNGCMSTRNQQVTSLMEQKEKLKGLTDQEIIKILGEPDETRLYQRTQRFFIYYTTPGPKCDAGVTSHSRLELRVSALNTVNEVVHYP